MELQSALLLLGIFIIGAVALNVYDKTRAARRYQGEKSAPDASPAQNNPPPQRKKLSLFAAKSAAGSGLDINPGPPDEAHQRFLKADDPAAPPPTKSTDFLLEAELQDMQHAAVMPVNVDFSSSAPVTVAGENQFVPDERIDFIVYLPAGKPVERDRALGIYKQGEYVVEKPHKLYGLQHPIGVWSNVEHDQEGSRYSDLALAMQMADGKGPVNESELNAFAQLALKLADSLRRSTKFSISFEQALEQAVQLDKFCQAYDILANIIILPNSKEGFGGRAIGQAAVRQGMQFGAMNIFHMKNVHSVGCRHLFSLANLFQPGEFNLKTLDTFKAQGLILFMIVPCVHNPLKVFDKMVLTAKGFCKILDGRMLDHERRPLTEKGLLVIRTQIEQITVDMQKHGIIPGSATALRLFKT
jgi:cell division protein ZipA